MPARTSLPLWLKLAFSAWIVVWAPTYAFAIGPQNFFWLCNVANFLILAGLWTENRRLLSMQLLSVLLVGVCWTIDVGTAVVAGFHPIGGTEYMLDQNVPLALRSLSLYHVILPVVAVPTSAGYGASLGGVTALLAMLASCAAGVTVVGIDNGFGAACAVARACDQRARRA